MTTQPDEDETIIRFSSAWWAYLFFRLGILRALVNGVEDALAITGRFLLLAFLIYCGAQAGLLLSDPTFSFPGWLQMTMFCTQLAGLEGSIPGLARQAGNLREQDHEDAARNVERVMLSARIMTILAIGEGALHALHVPALALQIISALLLVVRGIVITGFLIALAKIERTAPRVLSHDAHTREQEQQAQRDEQARTIADLHRQLEEARGALTTAQQGTQQSLHDHARSSEQFRTHITQLEATNALLVKQTESQGALIDRLQNQGAQAQEQIQQLTTLAEQKQREYERVSADLQTAHLQIVDLQMAASLTENLQTTHLQMADPTAKKRPAKGSQRHADLHSGIMSIDLARAKHEVSSQSKGKVSYAEVIAFMAANPYLKRVEVATQLGISERKVYDALAWQKEQGNDGSARSSL